MLFDLRGRGRRNTIKVIYVALAFLMGAGLIGFGIGGEGPGGIIDAITEGNSGGDVGSERFEKKEREALARTRTNPQDTAAWAELVRARVQLAGTGDRYNPDNDTYNAEGKAELKQAAQAWEKYLTLDPKNADEKSSVASLMVRTYVSLEDLTAAARAQEVVAEARETAGAYSQLAVISYEAGQTRKGDLAAKKALELTDPDMRESLKGQLDQAKQQALVESVQGAQPSG